MFTWPRNFKRTHVISTMRFDGQLSNGIRQLTDICNSGLRYFYCYIYMEHNLKIYMLFYRPIALVWLVITVKIYIYILSV